MPAILKVERIHVYQTWWTGTLSHHILIPFPIGCCWWDFFLKTKLVATVMVNKFNCIFSICPWFLFLHKYRCSLKIAYVLNYDIKNEKKKLEFLFIFYLGNEKIQSWKFQTNLVSKYRYILNFHVTTFYAEFSLSYKLKEWDFRE